MVKLRASTFVAALVAAGAVLGNSAQAQAQAKQNTSTDTATQAATENTADSGEKLGEILVTAQRRTERSQSVPISIVAVTPQAISALNIQNVQSLQLVTPGLTYATGINYALVSIRGIGNFNTNPGLEAPVATYIDGAYVERDFGSVYDIVDPANIEILKGPQGTLWGRNATGGVVLLNTADPELVYSGHVAAQVGSLDHQRVDGMLNIPLNDQFAARLAVRYRSDGGYVDNPTTKIALGWSKQWVARAKFAYEPSTDFKAVFEYQYDRSYASNEPNAETLPAVYCLFCAASRYTYPLSDPYMTTISSVQGGLGNWNTGNFYNLHLSYNVGDLALTSVTAYRRTDNFADGNFSFTEVLPGFNLYQTSGARTFTEDLQAETRFHGILNFAAGFNYLKDSPSYYNLWVSTGEFYSGPPANHYSVDTRSYSGFVEGRIKPVEKVTLTLGGRYTRDSRTDFGLGTSLSAAFNSFTPRAVLAYDAGETKLYASYNRGFKSGGFSGPPDPANIFKPETIDSYEVGAKFLSSDQRLRLDLAAFLYKYKSIQVLAVNQSNVGNISSATNAGSGKGTGFDLNTEYQPLRWLHAFAGASYVDAHYDVYNNAQVQVPLFNASGQPTGLGVGTVNLSGTPLPLAPKVTAAAGFTASNSLPAGWTGELTVGLHYSSSYYFTAGAGGPLRSDLQPAYTTGQLTTRFFPDGDRYELNFFVNNLTNATYDNYRFTTAPFGAYHNVAPPRTWGIGVTANF